MSFHHFPVNLKRFRKARGFSRKELAHMLQLGSGQAIGRWERGETEPSMDLIVRIAEVLDVSIESLFGDANNSRVVSFHNLGIGGAGCSFGVGFIAHYLAAHHGMLVACVNAKQCDYATRALEFGLSYSGDYRANGSIGGIPICKSADGIDSLLYDDLKQLQFEMGAGEAVRHVVSSLKESGYDYVLVDSDRISFEEGSEFARLADDLVLFLGPGESDVRLASSQFGKLSWERKMWNVFPISDYRFQGKYSIDWDCIKIDNFNVVRVNGVIPYGKYIGEIGAGIAQRSVFDDPRAEGVCSAYRKISDSLVRLS